MRALSRLLRHHDVFQAENYEQAEQILRDERLDLIVTDCVMPGRSGVDVLLTARTLQPKATRVMLSAYPPSDLQQLIDDGLIDEFFSKPWERGVAEELERVVAEGLAKAAAAPDSTAADETTD
ncbi:MAG: response regulator [Myxococcales bacterium]|nr:response regulator [Myxococcales bacterium]